jgi:hypothetical protein
MVQINKAVAPLRMPALGQKQTVWPVQTTSDLPQKRTAIEGSEMSALCQFVVIGHVERRSCPSLR